MKQRTLPRPGKKRGPYYDDIAKELQAVNELLPTIDPRLRPEHLFSELYMSRDSRLELREIRRSLDYDMYDALYHLNQMRLESMHGLGENIAAVTADSAAEGGIFADTPYFYQGDSGLASSMGCFNACYRMVFAEVTGEAVHEHSINSAAGRAYNDTIIEDDAYLKTFATPAFKSRYPDQAVTTVTFTGASIGMLTSIAARIKNVQPAASVSCIVNLQTEKDPTQSIWHTNVLLGDTSDSVIVHDPTDLAHGAARRELDRTEFHRRWAVALNRAHLVIAA